MIGAIIGDIVGSRFEFNNTKQTDFTLFTDRCGYTDDTICTIAVADALLTGKPYSEVLHGWCRRYPHPMGGYGGRFAQWVYSDHPQPYGSFGNGSAMRVSPCGWISKRAFVLNEATRSAQCTHNHPAGLNGARCIADSIFVLRNLLPELRADDKLAKQKFKEFVTKSYAYNLDQSVDEIRATNSFNETCQVTVPQAIICFLESTDFDSAIRLAVSIGGDSDTIAAMTGSLAEAYYGVPQDLREKALAYLEPEMIEVITKFEEKYG